jgi:heat shock protein HslJ
MNIPITPVLACMLMLSPGILCASPAGPADAEWYLLLPGDSQAPGQTGKRQAQLLLDSAHNKVTGFAGCNDFFGPYELSGAALSFGPLATTRKACPGEAAALEAGFLDVLARTQGWRIEGDVLLLLDDGNVLARLETMPRETSAVSLESLVFHSQVLTSGPVPLAQGVYSAEAAPGSASRQEARLTDTRAFGTLNGMEAGVVIVTTSLGGSGTFRELALLFKAAEGWVNTDTVVLGDRVRVNSVVIDGDVIVLSVTTHAPQDPQCCPTQDVQQRFAVRDGHLVPVPEAASSVRP